jgi:hypothetical protein
VFRALARAAVAALTVIMTMALYLVWAAVFLAAALDIVALVYWAAQ